MSRLVAGTGYGLAFVSCQGYVIDRTTRANRSQGVAMFVGGIMAADICGPAIGGILADRIGFVPTILAGAVLALGSAALALVLLDGREDVPPVRRASALAGAAAAIANWRFDLLVLLAALPAKLLLTGFLFYLAPLLLTDLGASQSEAGRIVMTYGIAAFLLGPAFAHASDRLRAHGVLVCVGGVVCGVAMLPILFTATPALVLVGVVGLGVGQAMSIASQLALVTIVSAREIARLGQAPILGAFRLLERLGAAAGPFVAAVGVERIGLTGTMAALGAYGAVSAALFGTVFLFGGYEPEPAPFALVPEDSLPTPTAGGAMAP
jgi:predicted MFS family arabinose efflux permease